MNEEQAERLVSAIEAIQGELARIRYILELEHDGVRRG